MPPEGGKWQPSDGFRRLLDVVAAEHERQLALAQRGQAYRDAQASHAQAGDAQAMEMLKLALPDKQRPSDDGEDDLSAIENTLQSLNVSEAAACDVQLWNAVIPSVPGALPDHDDVIVHGGGTRKQVCRVSTLPLPADRSPRGAFDAVLPLKLASSDRQISGGTAETPAELGHEVWNCGTVNRGLGFWFAAWKNQWHVMRTPLIHHLRPGLELHLDEEENLKRALQKSRDPSMVPVHSSGSGFIEETAEPVFRRGVSKILIQPGGTKRVAWDLAGAVMLLWDIVMIPVSVFGPEQTMVHTVMDWITMLFWTFDVFMSLITGVVKEGQVVMDPRFILRRYLVTWFALDMAVVIPDWVTTIMGLLAGEDDNGNNVGKSLRVLRIGRTARLLRLVAGQYGT
eukprot:TRINITY_DN13020_c0_g1_i1.p1 TRINITY_DN13020_c0_g1~~TRINITY_DN13020_c0_g1_i1.p1  ORF type:complete len:398 (-),score=67.22 TRINITY_DN13020_c0_g1_i1:189-1382(-)